LAKRGNWQRGNGREGQLAEGQMSMMTNRRGATGEGQYSEGAIDTESRCGPRPQLEKKSSLFYDCISSKFTGLWCVLRPEKHENQNDGNIFKIRNCGTIFRNCGTLPGGITIGSCQKVPTKRFLPKRSCKKSSCEKGSRDPKVPTERFLPKRFLEI
jgi:hypothetical protein